MDVRVVEVTDDAGQRGVFAVCRHTFDDWLEPRRLPPTAPSVLTDAGLELGDLWLLDLTTGEGAVFRVGGDPEQDLRGRRARVSPLFGPFLAHLYRHVLAAGPGGPTGLTWWVTLPRTLHLTPTHPGVAVAGGRPRGV